MIRVQIERPEVLRMNGFMKCPATETVHARLQDAVYPLFFMAKSTGDGKYLKAGINAFEWSDHNVSLPDGSWTNDLDPKSWNGTTVFGAIALAETLKYHSDLLNEERVYRWKERLGKAAEFVYQKFSTMQVTNINYGATNIYALYLIGKVLDEPKYIRRSKELAEEVKSCFTEPNTLLFGEIKPSIDKKSEKGLPGVDLGYNVEESLNGIVMYALESGDEQLLQILSKSLTTHLEFMLPDGGWDNSWGTRMFKWTYWGSRTCDGCQPAFGLMAKYNPAFSTAVIRNIELLKRCTANGLLHGGIHYQSHGIQPCIHHTFTHAKPLAFMLDHWEHFPKLNDKVSLPRVQADGVRYFEEIDTVLFARGQWRGTVTAYDAEYHPTKDVRQATGSSLSLLYHGKVGLICAASLAVYRQMEPLNMQDAPGEDIAFTPRIEAYQHGVWFTNLFDLKATFNWKDENGQIGITGNAVLKNEKRQSATGTASEFMLEYQCSESRIRIGLETKQELTTPTAFVLPILSPTGETVSQPDHRSIVIDKPEGIVRVFSNSSLKLRETEKERSFNMVPGAEALIIEACIERGNKAVELMIEVI